jgi:REP element-mobilizing transposase RayT
MVRMSRAEVFDPQEVAVAHVFARTVRRCFLFGDDPLTGKNFDHRKVWIENHLRSFAASFGIDLLGFAILSNHFHLILRSRPDVVATWDDTEVARRWLRLCPHRKHPDGSAKEPSEPELNAIRCCPVKRAEIRRRLSSISWWMRLLCQRVAMRANREDEENGRFFQDRYKAVRLLDEASLLACAAYVDLNPIRAAIAETLETSDHTSVQCRMEALGDGRQDEAEINDQCNPPPKPREPVVALRCKADQFLSPLTIDERTDATGPCASVAPGRCSDKGFLTLSLVDYLQLLDWTARQVARGKRSDAPSERTPVLERFGLQATAWTELVRDFGKLFAAVAGRPSTVDATRSHLTHRRFRVRRRVRELLSAAA